MDDLQSIIYVIVGSVGLGLMAEMVRATIWACTFYFVFRRRLMPQTSARRTK